jgi:hypothetical protein
LLCVAEVRMQRRVATALVLVVLSAGCSAGLGSRANEPHVLVYGDSLMEQAAAYVEATEINAAGGTAICDWTERILRDALVERPDLVVLQFAGNKFPFGCMAGHVDDAHEKYAWDVANLAARLSVPILWVRTPPPLDNMNDLYAAQPLSVDAGAAVTENGRFVWDLPCLPDELAWCGERGRIMVRPWPDEVHLCPQLPTCATYSSGARRFGDAINRGIARALA